MLSAFVAVSTALCSLGGSSCGVCSGHMSGSYRHVLWRANAPAPPHRHTAALLSSCNRRGALLLTSAALLSRGSIAPASARTPGSEDLSEAITQIRDGRTVLAKLRREWSQYAVIDAEGRAGNIDAARRVLGGVAPQRGEAAIAVAKTTPLYRIDGAFAAVRKAVLNGKAGEWGENIDVEEFVETAERINFSLKKADDSFYGVVFASKGTSQLQKIYDEAKSSVDSALSDFDKVMSLLEEAGA